MPSSSTQHPPVLQEFTDHLVNICQATHHLFGNSPVNARVKSLADRFRQEWNEMADTRGIEELRIGLVGPKNAGKTFLARLLIQDTDALESLPCGETSAQKTSRIFWIGSRPPANLDPEWESFVQITDSHRERIGPAYTLIDAPGLGDEEQALQQLAKRALLTTGLKIFVIRSSHMESSLIPDMLTFAEGSPVLPVIHLSSRYSHGFPDNVLALKQSFDQCKQAWIQAHPNLNFLDPLFLPDSEAGESFSENEIRQLLVDRLRRELKRTSAHQFDLHQALQASYGRFVRELRQILEAHLGHIENSYRELENIIGELDSHVHQCLFMENRPVEVMLKWSARLNLMERIPGILPPMRSIYGVLAFSAGFWDKLALSLYGSPLALAGAGIGMVKNIREKREVKSAMEQGLKDSLESEIHKLIAEPFQRFREDVTHLANKMQVSQDLPNPEIQVSGVDALVLEWLRLRDSVLEQHRPSRLLIRVLSLTGFAAFWFILAAPLIHIYGQFIPAALTSWSGNWSPGSFGQYPQLSPGFIFMCLLMALPPAFLSGMLLVLASTYTRRIRHARQSLSSGILKILQSRSNPVKIETRDETLQAARLLMKSIQLTDSSQNQSES